MKGKLLIGLLMTSFLFTAEAQTNKSKSKKKTKAKTSVAKSKKAVPSWGTTHGYKGNSHVYFPDYYAFYDPNRGYVYWNVASNSWTTSPTPPSFLSSVDMTKTRVEILKGLSLDLYPERNYPNYMKMYPARENDNKVPVPNHRQGIR